MMAKAPVASGGCCGACVLLLYNTPLVALVERVSCTTTRDGTVEAFDVKG